MFQGQLKERIIEEVKLESEVGSITYIPNKEVIKSKSTTTEVRKIFNASPKKKDGVNLNNILNIDPCMNLEIYKLMLQFPLYYAAITARIEKTYQQIAVKEEDRNYLRLCWFKDLFSNEESRTCKYRFTRVISGATCFQFLLKTTVENRIQIFCPTDPDFAKKVKRTFYVDDLNIGVYSVDEINLYKRMKVRFQKAKFNLRKWWCHNQILREFLKSLNVIPAVSVTFVKNDINS